MRPLPRVTSMIAPFCLLAASACGPFGRSPEVAKVEGARIAVLSVEAERAADPALVGVSISLPPPVRNAHWPDPDPDGRFFRHLALDGTSKRFDVPVVPGGMATAPLRAPPVVADAMVFAAGTGGVVTAVDMATGRIVWSRKAEERPSPSGDSSPDGGARVVTGIAHDDGKLFVATTDGRLSALSAKTGGLVWSIRNDLPFAGVPSARNGRVFVVSHDARLNAFSADDGSPLWTYAAIPEELIVVGAAGPLVTDHVVVAGFPSGEVIALNPINGRMLWTDSPFHSGGRVTPLSGLNAIVGRPVLDRDRVFVTSRGGYAAAMDLKTGRRIWTSDLVGSTETPWSTGSHVFVTSLDGDVVCLSRKDGKIRWIASPPFVGDGVDKEARHYGPVVLGGTVVLIDGRGRIVGLNPQDGSFVMEASLTGRTSVPPAVADGTLYVLTDDGRIVAFGRSDS